MIEVLIAASLFQIGFTFTACKEPDMCQCLWGCQVFEAKGIEGDGPFMCTDPLIVVPNFKIAWEPRDVYQQIAYAKENVAKEAAVEWEGKWKEHVLGGKKMGVITMYGLLGIIFALFKGNYQKRIKARYIAGDDIKKCDIAKCVAYCVNSCESLCADWDKSDDAFLEEIMWTPAQCDAEASKEEVKKMCNELKDGAKDCDASCDGAASLSTSSMVFFTMIFAWLVY